MNEFFEDDMPVELQLDLLVDEELPEEKRRQLLLSLDRDPAMWKELSIRFLQRQVERRSVRDLIAGGKLVSEVDDIASYIFARRRWWRSGRMMGVAAGFVIVVGTALATGYWMQHLDGGRKDVAAGGTGPVAAPREMVKAELPGAAMGMKDSVRVEIPVVSGSRRNLFPRTPNSSYDGPTWRNSIYIQPDGKDGAVVIPVNTLPMKVY